MQAHKFFLVPKLAEFGNVSRQLSCLGNQIKRQIGATSHQRLRRSEGAEVDAVSLYFVFWV